jgi:hypothetical protein
MELIQKYFLSWYSPLSKEHSGILMLLLSFLMFPYIIRMIDGTAAAIDPGIFSAVILAASSGLIFKALTWWVIKAVWPVFADYSTFQFEQNFRALPAKEKVLIYLGFYLTILYSFVSVMAALI